MKKYPLFYHKKLKIFFVLLWGGSENDRSDFIKVNEVTIYPNEKCFSKYKYGYILNKKVVFIDNFLEFKAYVQTLNQKK